MFEQPVPRIEDEELLCGCATPKLFIDLFICLYIYLRKDCVTWQIVDSLLLGGSLKGKIQTSQNPRNKWNGV